MPKRGRAILSGHEMAQLPDAWWCGLLRDVDRCMGICEDAGRSWERPRVSAKRESAASLAGSSGGRESNLADGGEKARRAGSEPADGFGVGCLLVV